MVIKSILRFFHSQVGFIKLPKILFLFQGPAYILLQDRLAIGAYHRSHVVDETTRCLLQAIMGPSVIFRTSLRPFVSTSVSRDRGGGESFLLRGEEMEEPVVALVNVFDGVFGGKTACMG